MTDLSLLQILLANLALLAGACLQGVAGYGIGTLAAPLLFLISPILIPAPLVLNAVVLTILMLLRNRGALQVREVRFAIGGGVGGMILAVFSLGGISRGVLMDPKVVVIGCPPACERACGVSLFALSLGGNVSAALCMSLVALSLGGIISGVYMSSAPPWPWS